MMGAESLTEATVLYAALGSALLAGAYHMWLLGAERREVGKATQTSRISEEDINDKMASEIEKAMDNPVIFVSYKSESYRFVLRNLIKTLVKGKDMGGIYISYTQPYDTIEGFFTEAGVVGEDVYFIDAISMVAGRVPSEKRENVAFIENPTSLEEVMMHVDNMLPKIRKKNRFIIIDSISSILIYSPQKVVNEFSHSIINKVRLEKTTGVMLRVENKESEDYIKTLKVMCDTIINL